MRLFKKMLEIDSSSGKEEEFATWCYENFEAPYKEFLDFKNGSCAVFLRWNEHPQVVYCSHLDTVPPYIPPTIDNNNVFGRGACDAKGQIYSMYKACKELENKGFNGFGLLLLSGEETGSFGAKEFAKYDFSAPFLVIGEPTENKIVTASKGTKSFELQFTGEAFHSGYPHYGRSAVDMFINFANELENCGRFPQDETLGDTTWNFGKLMSDNPQNVLSPFLSCKLYFRTTFASDYAVEQYMNNINNPNISIKSIGGDSPAYYHTVDGIEQTIVSFGSDAPHLTNFEHKMICGPGSIKYAHRDDEQISKKEIEVAIQNYINIYEQLGI